MRCNLHPLLPSVEIRVPPVLAARDAVELKNFKETLWIVLRGRIFLPKGGTLGFGLWY